MLSDIVNDHFVSVRGETGDLIRNTDWNKTPLGPVEKWPQSLITTIGTALKTKFPILIWWGQDLTLIYNDAYIPIFAGKHPNAFGKPGFSEFGWGEEGVRRVIEPMLRMVMESGEATWSEDQLLIVERNGFAEEAYFTWSYSPINVEGGKVGGVLTIVTETTERVIGQRRLNILNDLADRTAEVQSTDDAFSKITNLLCQHPLDLSFFLLYRIKSEDEVLYKSGESDLPPRAAINPERVSISESPWPFSEVIESGKELVIENLSERFGNLPGGAWPESSKAAVVLPITNPGQRIPYGILVAGISPRRALDENYTKFLKLLSDQISTAVSKVTALEEERRRTEALQEIDKAKTVFFSNISHEFRTPLTLVLGPLEELLRNNSLQVAEKNAVETTHRNAMRLLRLVNTLLDFSRLEAGRVKPRFVPVNLTSLTRDLASSFRSAIQNAGLEYKIDIDEVGNRVYVDLEMWEKIVLNLISNAFKYTLKGHITVRLGLDRGKVVLRVEDTGTGIPEEELPRIFERFHRVHNAAARTHEGTGIGLSLVYELVTLHGGKISAESIVGEGSTFSVEIRIGKEHLPQDQVVEDITENYESVLSDLYVQEARALTGYGVQLDGQMQQQFSPGSSNPPVNNRILVVDDNADMREYLSRLLAKQYTVQVASNGMHALQKLREFDAQVVVSDIMMPVMDGVQLVNSLKTNPATANIPVILLSARAGEEARIEGYEVGADDYLVKPFSAKELLARVKSQIKIATTRRRAETHLKNILQQAPVIIVIFRGPTFIIELANEKLLEYWDRKLEDIIQKPLVEAVPEIAAQELIEILTNVYTTGEHYIAKEREVYLKRNGQLEPTYVSFVYEPLRNEDGSTYGIIVVADEVTDAVIARKKIEASEAKFRNLVIQAPVGITILKAPDFVVEVANDSYLGLVNRTKEEFVGKPVFESLPELVNTPVPGYLNQVITTGESYYGFELPLVVKRYGREDQCYFNFVYQALKENDRATGVIAVVIEVTEVVNARQKAQDIALELEQRVNERTSELTLANSRLAASNHDLEQFAYVASHDLQEPLRKIQTFSELLKKRLEDSESVRKYLEKIETSAARMTSLIKDVLNYSRLSKGKDQFVAVDLNVILKHVETDFELLIKEKGAKIRFKTLPTITAIPLQMNQLFYNIISNSLKFSNENPMIEIEGQELSEDEVRQNTSLYANHRYVKLTFKDNGIGFEQKYADKIFIIFQRLQYDTAYSGTGIGLALCKKIVENHNGTIEAFSELGKGSVFVIHLPVNYITH